MERINQEWVKSEIKKMKAHEEERSYVLGVIATELKPFDAKQINKRIIVHLRSKLRKYTITEISTGYSGYKEFKIWGEGIDYGEYIVIRIGEFSIGNNRLNYTEMKEHLAQRMAEIRKFILKMEKTINDLPRLSKQYQEGFDKLEEIEKEMGSSNRLLKFFPLANLLHRA